MPTYAQSPALNQSPGSKSRPPTGISPGLGIGCQSSIPSSWTNYNCDEDYDGTKRYLMFLLYHGFGQSSISIFCYHAIQRLIETNGYDGQELGQTRCADIASASFYGVNPFLVTIGR
jgi:hypothetical protein